MKKILCATTALVAVGFAGSANAAEPLTASLGGYMYIGGGYSDVDANSGVGILRDGEIYANITGSSDNGLTFNGHVQFEAFSSADPVDENWGEVEGSFGAVRFGSDDHASYNTAVGLAFFQGAHINVYDNFVEAGGGFRSNNRFSDVIGLHYYTPRISGFQAALSYHPNGGNDGANDSNSMETNDDGAAGSATDVISIGANYTGEFGMTSLGLSAGYDYVDDLNGSAAGDTDGDGFSFGASIGAAGFTLGGFYQSALDNVGTDTDDYVASLTYGTGPWTFGAQYGYFEQDMNGGGDQYKLAGWGEYQLAPGVDFGVGAEYQDTDGGTAQGAFANSEGFAVMAIMGLSF